MDVYILPSPLSSLPDYKFWQPPQLLCFAGNSPQGVNIVTAGGLIRDGNNVYMVVVDDLSLLGWSACSVAGSSTRSKDHKQCAVVSKHVEYQYNNQQNAVGIIGKLVHFSLDQGYGLVRVLPDWYVGDEDAVGSAAIPIASLAAHIDEPEMMDFVEFTTSSGEEVTGVIVGTQSCCIASGSARSRMQALVVNTSSYAVLPEDCGTWVRRSVASDRPMLLGHIIGFSEQDYSMLVLPFQHFREDLHRVIRRRGFNLVG